MTIRSLSSVVSRREEAMHEAWKRATQTTAMA